LGIGTSSPSDNLHIYASSGGATIKIESNLANAYDSSKLELLGGNLSTSEILLGDASVADVGKIIYRHDGNSLAFNVASAERMRIDSSGTFMVAKSSSDNGTTAGFETFSNGNTYITRSSATANVNTVVTLNRLTSDGDIARFQKDGTTVGSIGNRFGAMYVHSPDGTNGAGLRFFDGVIQPCESNGNDSDNDTDLGQVNSRFDDIYATNGTIQTSDRNEKQDIAELSDAEQRVAVAAKGLLRKFRWRDAVEAKGDEARTHFGVIAQDLQAAFATEGLDAGDYAMFISSTWTDEETGEERTRMGVRYSELLAFIIAAI